MPRAGFAPWWRGLLALGCGAYYGDGASVNRTPWPQAGGHGCIRGRGDDDGTLAWGYYRSVGYGGPRSDA